MFSHRPIPLLATLIFVLSSAVVACGGMAPVDDPLGELADLRGQHSGKADGDQEQPLIFQHLGMIRLSRHPYKSTYSLDGVRKNQIFSLDLQRDELEALMDTGLSFQQSPDPFKPAPGDLTSLPPPPNQVYKAQAPHVFFFVSTPGQELPPINAKCRKPNSSCLMEDYVTDTAYATERHDGYGLLTDIGVGEWVRLILIYTENVDPLGCSVSQWCIRGCF